MLLIFLIFFLLFSLSHIIYEHHDEWRNTVIRNPTWSHLRALFTGTKKVFGSNCVVGRTRCLYVFIDELKFSLRELFLQFSAPELSCLQFHRSRRTLTRQVRLSGTWISGHSFRTLTRFGAMRSAYIFSQPHAVALLVRFIPNSVSMNISYLNLESILYRWPTTVLFMVSLCNGCWFLWCCASSNCLATDGLAVYTGGGSVPWIVSRSRCDWWYL